MDEDETTYPEYRHAVVALYGRFRIDKTWIRTNPTDEKPFGYVVVFEIDADTEFDLTSSLLWAAVYPAEMYKRAAAGEMPSPAEIHRLFAMYTDGVGKRLAAGEMPSSSEMQRLITGWLHYHRPTPGGGLASTACYRRRIGPADAEQEATPVEWYTDHLFRRLGKPMVDMHEAVPLVEAALRELEETGMAEDAVL